MPVKDCKFVIVDDNADDLADMRDFVENKLCYDVIGTAASGPEMVKIVLDKKPDFVMFDLKLPGFDGLVAINHIWEVYPVPAIAVTGYDDTSVIERLEKRLCIGYVTKPLERVNEIQRQIDHILALLGEFDKLHRPVEGPQRQEL